MHKGKEFVLNIQTLKQDLKVIKRKYKNHSFKASSNLSPQFNKKLYSFAFSSLYLYKCISLTIIRRGGGGKYVTSSLMACRSEWNRGRSVKPHCICHFWCLKSLYGMILGGYVKFFENFEFWKKIFFLKLRRKFWKFFFSKKIVTFFKILYQKLNSICFLLSFDVHIVHIGHKFQFSKNWPSKFEWSM